MLVFKRSLLLVCICFLWGYAQESGEGDLRSYRQRVPLKKSGEYLVKNLLRGREIQNGQGLKLNVFDNIQINAPLKSLKWTLPSSWEKKQAAGMRFALFYSSKSKLSISLTSFPGAVGGLKANILRWIGQMQLPEHPSVEEVREYLSSLDFSQNPQGLPFLLIDLRPFTKKIVTKESEKKAMLVGIFRFSDETLFVKMSGTNDKIALDYKNFKDFLSSFGVN